MFVWYEYAIIITYLVAILGIGAWFSKKGSENVDEYFLGGKSMPWWVLGISFMTSNLDLTGTMVIASFFAMVGLKGFLVELRGGTCLPLAMFMIFMAKWHRRAGVMTVAEWMEFRFGSDSGARAARITSAFAVVIMVLAMSAYFCVGFGKFLSLYFPFSPNVCAIIFTSIATVHILASGLYGVAYTDVFQGVMILFVVLYISIAAFTSTPDASVMSEAWTALGQEGMTWDQWTGITPGWTEQFPEGYEAYNLFGVLMIFWILRIYLEGFGGPLIPYASQRFFAAKDERDASLTTATSLILFVVRWPFIIAIAILGLSLGSAIPADPEMIFPQVVSQYFPMGLRAVIVSCLVAAAMSTYDSTLNAGGAYIVNDLYHRFIDPKASSKRLVRISWIATIGISAIALAVASTIDSINDIWSWISMSFFGGFAVPMIVRWYWERFTGWGYTIGTIAGIGAAVVQKLVFPEAPEFYQLGITGGAALVGCIVGSLATSPPSMETLKNFYTKTRPFGFWAGTRKNVDREIVASIRKETRRDMFSSVIAMAAFFFFFLSPMYLVIKDYGLTLLTAGLTVVAAVILYFSWYKHLKRGT